jgi:hypothetical protein
MLNSRQCYKPFHVDPLIAFLNDKATGSQRFSLFLFFPMAGYGKHGTARRLTGTTACLSSSGIEWSISSVPSCLRRSSFALTSLWYAYCESVNPKDTEPYVLQWVTRILSKNDILECLGYQLRLCERAQLYAVDTYDIQSWNPTQRSGPSKADLFEVYVLSRLSWGRSSHIVGATIHQGLLPPSTIYQKIIPWMKF